MKVVKWFVFLFVFLMLASCVLAMDDPIRVKVRAGDEVRVNIWPAEYGPVINLDKGVADDDGVFTSKVFFSLSSSNYTLQVAVLDSEGDNIGGGRFEGMNSLSPIFVDCVSSDCALSFWEVDEESENETVAVANETVVESESVSEGETVVENETVVVSSGVVDKDMLGGIVLTGRAIFLDENGSLNLGYSIGGLAVMLCLVIFIFGMLHRGKSKVADVLDGDDKELEYMEKKVKETEGKIKNIKEHDAKKRKLEEAKAKLAADERELEDLERGKERVESGEVRKDIEEQKTMVEGDEEKVEEKAS